MLGLIPPVLAIGLRIDKNPNMERDNYFRKRQALAEAEQRQSLARLSRQGELSRQKRIEIMVTLLNPTGNSPKSLLGDRADKLCSDFLEVMRERRFQFAQIIQPDRPYWRRVRESVGLGHQAVHRSWLGVIAVPDRWNWPPPRQGYDIGVYSYDDGTGSPTNWQSRLYLCTDGMIRNSSAGSLPTGAGLEVKHIVWRHKEISYDPIYGSSGYPEPYTISLEDILFRRMNAVPSDTH